MFEQIYSLDEVFVITMFAIVIFTIGVIVGQVELYRKIKTRK